MNLTRFSSSSFFREVVVLESIVNVILNRGGRSSGSVGQGELCDGIFGYLTIQAFHLFSLAWFTSKLIYLRPA